MSDWKNDRAEAEMQKAERENMEKVKIAMAKEIDEKWDKVKASLYVGSKPEDDSIDGRSIGEEAEL